MQLMFEQLQFIHSEFFRRHSMKLNEEDGEQECTIIPIIQSLKYQLFTGCRITFSGIVPLDRDPSSHILWKCALSYGAQCYVDLNEDITHVVSSRKDTDKVLKGNKMSGVSVVRPDWLFASIDLGHRQNEQAFLLQPPLNVILTDEERRELDLLKMRAEDDLIGLKFGEEDWEDAEKDLEDFLESDSSAEDDLQGNEFSEEMDMSIFEKELQDALDESQNVLKLTEDHAIEGHGKPNASKAKRPLIQVEESIKKTKVVL